MVPRLVSQSRLLLHARKADCFYTEFARVSILFFAGSENNSCTNIFCRAQMSLRKGIPHLSEQVDRLLPSYYCASVNSLRGRWLRAMSLAARINPYTPYTLPPT